MGPQASTSYPGQQLVKAAGPRAGRAKQEIDDGRRGVTGDVCSTLQPATGAAFTLTYERRTTVNWVDLLSAVEDWIDPAVERVDAVLDNLNIHSAPDVLLFGLLHPRWEFALQPKYAAYLNLIEPWWKVLRSLVLAGRRFAAWAEIERAVERATAYWNEHKHPFIWGRRRRHRQPALGIAAAPKYSDLADAPLRRRRARVAAVMVPSRSPSTSIGPASLTHAAALTASWLTLLFARATAERVECRTLRD
jgi:hypothetical protein